MEIKKVEKANRKYLGVPTEVTTVYYTEKVKNQKVQDEGLRLIIRRVENIVTDVKLVEGLAGRFEKNVPFFQHSEAQAYTRFQAFNRGVK